MFDVATVDPKDFNFFADIKEQVMSAAEGKGIVDRVYVEKTTGCVWLRYRGESADAIKSATGLIDLLNDKAFDGRQVAAKFVPDTLFYAKVK